MRTQRRNKRTIYLCQKVIENNLVKYRKPIELKENFHSTLTNEKTDLVTMGMDYPTRIIIKADRKAYVNGKWIERASLYHIGDRLYVFNKPPQSHDTLCKTADYEVEIEPNLGVTINQQEIVLLKRSGKDINKA